MANNARITVNSTAAFLKAQKLMPGGVSSPVRAFKGVGGTPVFIKEAEGCLLTDVDGNQYIDYIGSYGPMIVGHANERVVAALSKAIGRGTSFGAPTEAEATLAEKICSALPGMEMLRFVNSGTEAVMSALRLARAATGREKVVKCIGCYHGHLDSLLVSAGSGALTLGTPNSPGVPQSVTANTLLVHYNDLEGTARLFEQYGDQIACMVIEPVAGNMGLVLPAAGYLQGIRDLCTKHGAMLLFDEVMTGFRVAWGGAQVRFGIRPDLTCVGKVIGGGLPCAAYAGPAALMEKISPSGPVYQAGTLSGNPLAMAAGLATLEILEEPGAYESLEECSSRLAGGLAEAAAAAGVPVALNQIGSMVGMFFSNKPVLNYADATASDTAAFARFFHAMLDHGVHLPPSQFEAVFVSLAHGEDVIDTTIKAASRAFDSVKL
ncbi:MAG: hemL [Phycisphaerales bacterium]|nr:hemL [Phycisphaerales bacterium]